MTLDINTKSPVPHEYCAGPLCVVSKNRDRLTPVNANRVGFVVVLTNHFTPAAGSPKPARDGDATEQVSNNRGQAMPIDSDSESR